MYDVAFSEHWILDLCLNSFNSLLLLVLLPLAAVIIYTVVLIKNIRNRRLLISFLLVSYIYFAVFYIIYFYIYLVIGYSICRMSTYYKAIEPAHAIHAQIKDSIRDDTMIPRNLTDLKNLDNDNFNEMMKHAKVAYIWDDKTKTYTFFVRPSRYLTAIFDSKKDYQEYDLRKSANSTSWPQSFPPDYKGPWDKLPN